MQMTLKSVTAHQAELAVGREQIKSFDYDAATSIFGRAAEQRRAAGGPGRARACPPSDWAAAQAGAHAA